MPASSCQAHDPSEHTLASVPDGARTLHILCRLGYALTDSTPTTTTVTPIRTSPRSEETAGPFPSVPSWLSRLRRMRAHRWFTVVRGPLGHNRALHAIAPQPSRHPVSCKGDYVNRHTVLRCPCFHTRLPVSDTNPVRRMTFHK